MKAKNSPIPNSDSEIELSIDSLSFHGGRGVGRFEGIVVFVPETAPGDLIRARVVRRKARMWEAELIKILEPARARREPPCPVAMRCGGCSWQHVEYSEQVKQKEKILEQSLRGLRKFGTWESRPFLAAPEEFHYRGRVQLQVRDQRFGFFAKRSHELVETRTCLIAARPIDDALKSLTVEGQIDRLELALDENGGLHMHSGKRSGEMKIFAQVNRAQNEILRAKVVEAIEGAPDWIYDLYAGSGNLTLPLHARFPRSEVHAIELSRQATELGRARAPEIKWHAGDMGQALTKLKSPSGTAGVIVLDPPRAGCTPEVPPAIAALRAKQIVYVSCNPTTFARDVTPWLASGQYRLTRVQGMDMFPQTEHVEMIASLCAAT